MSRQSTLLRVTNDTPPYQPTTYASTPVTHVTKIWLGELLVIIYTLPNHPTSPTILPHSTILLQLFTTLHHIHPQSPIFLPTFTTTSHLFPHFPTFIQNITTLPHILTTFHHIITVSHHNHLIFPNSVQFFTKYHHIFP